jgi:NADH-quinone oxidoreductase subunit A
LGLALAVSAAILTLTTLLGRRPATVNKGMPYECGIRSQDHARQPFRNRFYLIAVLFLLFDVEGAFFFPWALVYRQSLVEGPALLIAMLVYMAFLVLGLVYILRKRVLELA